MSLALFHYPERRRLDPGILLIAGSHGTPPTQARLRRAGELAFQLARRGAAVDLALLIESPLQPYEEDQIAGLRRWVREIELVEHPELGSLLQRLLSRAAGTLSGRSVGGPRDCPGRFLHVLASKHAPRNYRAAIALGARFARTLHLFGSWTERIIDLDRTWSEPGSGDGDAGPAGARLVRDPTRELELLYLADAVIVPCAAGAVRLRERGFQGDLVCTPPAGALDGAPVSGSIPPPLSPPRIVCVGSATPANLEGISWFRREIHARVLERVPAARLRIVGEAARVLDPGPDVDRIGWVEDLDEEYRNAAVVALPLLRGGGLRRRAVEAVWRGKALAATTAGAWGLGAAAMRDAIVADDAEPLAGEIARVLAGEEARREYEARAAALATEAFDPRRSFAQLAERLGLPEGLEPRPAATENAAAPVVA